MRRVRQGVHPGAIDLDMKEAQETLDVGAVILGFGFEPFWAQKKGEYGLGRYMNVLTSIQFERMLSTSSPTQGLSDSDFRREARCRAHRVYPMCGLP